MIPPKEMHGFPPNLPSILNLVAAPPPPPPPPTESIGSQNIQLHDQIEG